MTMQTMDMHLTNIHRVFPTCIQLVLECAEDAPIDRPSGVCAPTGIADVLSFAVKV